MGLRSELETLVEKWRNEAMRASRTGSRQHRFADELSAILAAHPSARDARACRSCGRPVARDGEVSHEGKCRRALAEQYGARSGPDHDDCAAHPQADERAAAESWALIKRDIEAQALCDVAEELESAAPGSATKRANMAAFLRRVAAERSEPQTEEQAARERLGRWLVEHCFSDVDMIWHSASTREGYTVKLFMGSTVALGMGSNKPTLAEAINAALDDAERPGR